MRRQVDDRALLAVPDSIVDAFFGLPGLVTERDNGYLAVRYERLVPLLVEAIKELTNKVENLEQKLQDK